MQRYKYRKYDDFITQEEKREKYSMVVFHYLEQLVHMLCLVEALKLEPSAL